MKYEVGTGSTRHDRYGSIVTYQLAPAEALQTSYFSSMAGIDPYHVVGYPDPESERRACQFCAGLEKGEPARRQHRLLALASLWFPISSSFGPRPGHAMPVRSQIDLVARYAGEDYDDVVRLSALVAIRAAWRACDRMRSRSSDDGDPGDGARWEIPTSSIEAVRRMLGARSVVLRINAARLTAELPLPDFLPTLRGMLDDQVWTVRWNAVAAIAAIEPDEALLDVLLSALPREPDGHGAVDFRHAVAIFRVRGFPLPPELSPYAWP